MNQKTYIQTKDVQKSFFIKDGEVKVLKNINVSIKQGEFVIIFGPSGCGKSTLLHTLIGLEAPSEGAVTVENDDFYGMSEDDRAMYRRFHFGIIYQQPLWISSLNVRDNVAFTLHLMDKSDLDIDKRVYEVLQGVGLDQWATYRPMELSSGQQQKVSLARALALDPILIIADEPTGNLDTVSGQELIDTFYELNQQGKTIIMVTHDLEYLRYGNHLIHMLDGEVVEELFPENSEVFKGIKGKRGTIQTSVETNVRDPHFLSNFQHK